MKSFAITVAVAALRPVPAVHSGTIATGNEKSSIGDIATKRQAHHHAGGVRKRQREESHQHNNSIVSLLDDEYIEETICFDTDDRVPSNDLRIGRLIGRSVCTAWLISEDVVVTAGHCVDEEKQAKVPRGWVVEFNVPRSTSSGYPVNSVPEDQYNVRFDQGGMHPEFEVEWFDSEDGGFDYIGNDWAVGRLLPNEITGLKAGEQQGCWFNLEYDQPVNRQEIRITGYGINNLRDEDFMAQTTHVGPYRDVVDKSNPYILRYTTDTTGGNSGGPVINEATGGAIGIHTNAGCRGSGFHNHGMSNHQPMFVSAVSRYLGATDPASDQIRSPVCPRDFPGKPPRESTPSPTREPTSSTTFQPTVTLPEPTEGSSMSFSGIDSIPNQEEWTRTTENFWEVIYNDRDDIKDVVVSIAIDKTVSSTAGGRRLNQQHRGLQTTTEGVSVEVFYTQTMAYRGDTDLTMGDLMVLPLATSTGRDEYVGSLKRLDGYEELTAVSEISISDDSGGDRGPTLSPVTTLPPSLVIPILSTQSPVYAYPTGSRTLQPDPTHQPTFSTGPPTQKPLNKKKKRDRAKKTGPPTQKPTLKSEPRKKKRREPGRRGNSRAKQTTQKKKRERNYAVSSAHGLSSVSGSRQQ